jgi:hypothetical protein
MSTTPARATSTASMFDWDRLVKEAQSTIRDFLVLSTCQIRPLPVKHFPATGPFHITRKKRIMTDVTERYWQSNRVKKPRTSNSRAV